MQLSNESNVPFTGCLSVGTSQKYPMQSVCPMGESIITTLWQTLRIATIVKRYKSGRCIPNMHSLLDQSRGLIHYLTAVQTANCDPTYLWLACRYNQIMLPSEVTRPSHAFTWQNFWRVLRNASSATTLHSRTMNGCSCPPLKSQRQRRERPFAPTACSNMCR